MEVRSDVETSNRPCGRISRSLAFAAMRKGEARMRRSKGPKPLRRTPLSDSPARRETPTVSNPSNRRIRTRMYGGVGGEESRDSPLSRSLTHFGSRRLSKKFQSPRPNAFRPSHCRLLFLRAGLWWKDHRLDFNSYRRVSNEPQLYRRIWSVAPVQPVGAS